MKKILLLSIAIWFCRFSFVSSQTLKSYDPRLPGRHLDSIIAESYSSLYGGMRVTEKANYAYDSVGNLIQYYRTSRNYFTHELVVRNKEDYSYDNESKRIGMMYYEWVDSISEWNLVARHAYHYDENGYRTRIDRYGTHALSNGFNLLGRTLFVFNNQGLNIDQTHKNWGFDSNKWINTIRQLTEYGETGNILNMKYLYWNSNTNQWRDGDYKEYTYDENLNLVKFILYRGITNGSPWGIEYMWEYYYDNENRLIREDDSESSKHTHWQLSYTHRFDYYYDEDDRLYEKILFGWSSINQHWGLASKNEYIFDENGNCIENKIYKAYDQGQLYFEFSYKHDFDTTYLYEDLSKPDWYGYQGVSTSQMVNLIESTSYHRNSTDHLYSFYYSDNTISAIHLEPSKQFEELILYPNPTSDFIMLDIPFGETGQVEVHDQMGRMILAREIPFDHRIPVSNLKSGFYTLRVSRMGRMEFGRFIIQ